MAARRAGLKPAAALRPAVVPRQEAARLPELQRGQEHEPAREPPAVSPRVREPPVQQAVSQRAEQELPVQELRVQAAHEAR